MGSGGRGVWWVAGEGAGVMTGMGVGMGIGVGAARSGDLEVDGLGSGGVVAMGWIGLGRFSPFFLACGGESGDDKRLVRGMGKVGG